MKLHWLLSFGIAFIPAATFAANSMYCPQKQGYIRVGMSEKEVLGLCGAPQNKLDSSDGQIVQKVPVTQLIYTTLNQGAVYSGLTSYYTMWSLPSGSSGTSLQVNIIDNKVASISINGSNSNSSNVCGGVSIEPGDDANKVYSACGSPSLVNNTWIRQPLNKKQRPEIWIYQTHEYQPSTSLTFINGKLQSIQ